jgi:hypothetical protein
MALEIDRGTDGTVRPASPAGKRWELVHRITSSLQLKKCRASVPELNGTFTTGGPHPCG